MCQALLALEIEELNKVDKNVCPRGDYLLEVGDSVKVLLMLTGKNRVGRKKNTVGKGRETSTTVCSLLFLFFFFKYFYCSIVDLQCSVNFCSNFCLFVFL